MNFSFLKRSTFESVKIKDLRIRLKINKYIVCCHSTENKKYCFFDFLDCSVSSACSKTRFSLSFTLFLHNSLPLEYFI